MTHRDNLNKTILAIASKKASTDSSQSRHLAKMGTRYSGRGSSHYQYTFPNEQNQLTVPGFVVVDAGTNLISQYLAKLIKHKMEIEIGKNPDKVDRSSDINNSSRQIVANTDIENMKLDPTGIVGLPSTDPRYDLFFTMEVLKQRQKNIIDAAKKSKELETTNESTKVNYMNNIIKNKIKNQCYKVLSEYLMPQAQGSGGAISGKLKKEGGTSSSNGKGSNSTKTIKKAPDAPVGPTAPVAPATTAPATTAPATTAPLEFERQVATTAPAARKVVFAKDITPIVSKSDGVRIQPWVHELAKDGPSIDQNYHYDGNWIPTIDPRLYVTYPDGTYPYGNVFIGPDGNINTNQTIVGRAEASQSQDQQVQQSDPGREAEAESQSDELEAPPLAGAGPGEQRILYKQKTNLPDWADTLINTNASGWVNTAGGVLSSPALQKSLGPRWGGVAKVLSYAIPTATIGGRVIDTAVLDANDPANIITTTSNNVIPALGDLASRRIVGRAVASATHGMQSAKAFARERQPASLASQPALPDYAKVVAHGTKAAVGDFKSRDPLIQAAYDYYKSQSTSAKSVEAVTAAVTAIEAIRRVAYKADRGEIKGPVGAQSHADREKLMVGINPNDLGSMAGTVDVMSRNSWQNWFNTLMYGKGYKRHILTPPEVPIYTDKDTGFLEPADSNEKKSAGYP